MGVVMFLVPEVEDCFGCVCVFVVDFSYGVFRVSTDWDDDNQIAVLSLFDSVAIEDVYKFRDDWDKCIVGSVDKFYLKYLQLDSISNSMTTYSFPNEVRDNQYQNISGIQNMPSC